MDKDPKLLEDRKLIDLPRSEWTVKEPIFGPGLWPAVAYFVPFILIVIASAYLREAWIRQPAVTEPASPSFYKWSNTGLVPSEDTPGPPDFVWTKEKGLRRLPKP